jgi:hypothetical protein
MVYYIKPPPRGPLARIFAGIVAVLLFLGTLAFGLVAFLVIAALAAVAGIVIWLRVWWIKRRLEKEGFKPHDRRSPEPTGHVIDAEYTVVEDSDGPPDRQH